MNDSVGHGAHEAAVTIPAQPPTSSAYILDNALEQARERLQPARNGSIHGQSGNSKQLA